MSGQKSKKQPQQHKPLNSPYGQQSVAKQSGKLSELKSSSEDNPNRNKINEKQLYSRIDELIKDGKGYPETFIIIALIAKLRKYDAIPPPKHLTQLINQWREKTPSRIWNTLVSPDPDVQITQVVKENKPFLKMNFLTTFTGFVLEINEKDWGGNDPGIIFQKLLLKYFQRFSFRKSKGNRNNRAVDKRIDTAVASLDAPVLFQDLSLGQTTQVDMDDESLPEETTQLTLDLEDLEINPLTDSNMTEIPGTTTILEEEIEDNETYISEDEISVSTVEKDARTSVPLTRNYSFVQDKSLDIDKSSSGHFVGLPSLEVYKNIYPRTDGYLHDGYNAGLDNSTDQEDRSRGGEVVPDFGYFDKRDFFPSTNLPDGSILRMVNLNVLYDYISCNWGESEHQAYNSAKRNNTSEAWKLIRLTAENMLMPKMPISKRANNPSSGEATASQILEIIQNSAMIQSPLNDFSNTVTQFQRTVAALDSSIASISQGVRDNAGRVVTNRNEIPVPPLIVQQNIQQGQQYLLSQAPLMNMASGPPRRKPILVSASSHALQR